MLDNTRQLLRGMLWSSVAGSGPRLQRGAAPSVGKLAYGVSIAAGTTAYVVARQFGLV
jgi:prepilin peptidase CpaA